MPKPTTICAYCKEALYTSNTPGKKFKGNYLCKAIELDPVVDVVTGLTRWLFNDELLDTPHPPCEKINDGNCKHHSPFDPPKPKKPLTVLQETK